MSTRVKYAYKRHNTWVYRRTYPKHLQAILGSSLKQSLKTADAKQAKARVAELNQTFTSIVKEAQLLNWLWLCLDISVQGFWVSSLLLS